MAYFVINNSGETPIYTDGVELLPGACRGCPMEHLDKIDAPDGAEYYLTHCPDMEPEKVDLETGLSTPAQAIWSPDILIDGEPLKIGERTDVITAGKEPLAMVLDAAEDEMAVK